jgi:hypothetical protein
MTNNKDNPSLSNKTLTLRDTSATCKHCAKPIRWERNDLGKFVPVEPATGIDHRERCNGMAPTTRATLHNQNHEAAVKGFFHSLGASLGVGGAAH